MPEFQNVYVLTGNEIGGITAWMCCNSWPRERCSVRGDKRIDVNKLDDKKDKHTIVEVRVTIERRKEVDDQDW
jgi:hypothetical protein